MCLVIRLTPFLIEIVPTIADELSEAKEQMEREQKDAAGNIALDDGDAAMGEGGESSASIVSVCQRVKATVQKQPQSSINGNNTSADGSAIPLEEIWALVEFEAYNPDMPESALPPKRYRKWKRFDTESELSDFIRRDTGEPLTLPPYSLDADQSSRIQDKAKVEVSQVTEEFRRFRVRAELARKQAEAHIKELQSSHVQTAQRRIEGQDLVSHQELVVGAWRQNVGRVFWIYELKQMRQGLTYIDMYEMYVKPQP